MAERRQPEPTFFASASEFRAWLEAHHESATELLVGFHKRKTGRPSLTWVESVQEALCYGWIDGITFRIDDELTATRFTPRRRSSNWSAVNIAKIAELSARGRMHMAGIRAFEERDRSKDAVYSYERPALELEPEMVARFDADAGAWANWQAEAPSYRRMASYWVMSAKRPETRKRRFDELLEVSRAGQRPRAFIVRSADR
jgi:uncharacterized protein YdeI (YjbR/CyaY-like superfamily)